ncbi:glycosyltransferase family 39 protein [Chryseobacterium caseinilyticum]|uniref:Glycosyltransferase family 39 protein n=1 Tax=Chryseobacterium caseinilyticum TaxID=2771428 RepID=A0ABR8ZG68_9FLAO|nr:glycosyltransferase family 39 protein [Chryseobacterium caseinilyticum]MBD8084247.1 glycosyltransferase family 39 protein [Chryseobacterium caseinilyticum]
MNIPINPVKTFLISMLLFMAVCSGYYFLSLTKTDGHYIYVIDDAYIHLAMAKNFALHNVWGVTKYRFSSSSSSPLFTFMIGILIKIFGNNDLIPLHFNIVFSGAVIFILNKFYSKLFSSDLKIISAVVFTCLFVTLHLQVLIGMEHVFQVFVFALNVFFFYHLNQKNWAKYGFFISLLFLGLIRFESMFYFVVLAFLFFLIKNFRYGIAVLILGFLPIAILCLFNHSQSGYWFPNSVVVKGTAVHFNSNFIREMISIIDYKLISSNSLYKIGLFPILISAWFVFQDRKKSFRDILKQNFMLIVLSGTFILHCLFAETKSMFRYEAYIIVGFSMAVFERISRDFVFVSFFKFKNVLISGFLLANFVLMIYKSSVSHKMLVFGNKNIYEQQIQSAKFLHTYYNDAKVVANDIGAVTYFTDIHLLDIVGLGSAETIPFNGNEVTFDYRFKNFLTQYTKEKNFDVAIIYDHWLNGQIPDTWKKAADLKISDNVNTAGSTVSVYSIDSRDLETLKTNIRNFKWNKNVQVIIK